LRKPGVILVGVLAILSGFSQDLVRNPAKPLNPQAGRVLKLEPMFEISDASGDFYFKYPQQFQLDGRGFLHILEGDFIFTKENDQEKNVWIRKYKILNGTK